MGAASYIFILYITTLPACNFKGTVSTIVPIVGGIEGVMEIEVGSKAGFMIWQKSSMKILIISPI